MVLTKKTIEKLGTS